MILPLYIRIPLAPARLLIVLILASPLILMMLSGFTDAGETMMNFVMHYGNKSNWRDD